MSLCRVPRCARRTLLRTRRRLTNVAWFPKLATDELASFVVDFAAQHEPSTYVASTLDADADVRLVLVNYCKSRLMQDAMLHVTHDSNLTLLLMTSVAALETSMRRL